MAAFGATPTYRSRSSPDLFLENIEYPVSSDFAADQSSQFDIVRISSPGQAIERTSLGLYSLALPKPRRASRPKVTIPDAILGRLCRPASASELSSA
jgi:hypothetical protein